MPNPQCSDEPLSLATRNCRRTFISAAGGGLGATALALLLRASAQAPSPDSQASDPPPRGRLISRSAKQRPSAVPQPGRARRIIYLHQSGAPSQLDLFDYKPELTRLHGQQLPESIRGGQRLTELTANQSALPLAGSPFKFAQHGQAGTWLSELLPHHRHISDEICVIRSMYTEAINHVQAASLLHTGSEQPGRPSLGAWTSYGLGGLNQNVPSYVVMVSKGSAYRGGESLQRRLWSSGFISAEHQGVKFRSSGDPVLYLSNPAGITRQLRRRQLDALSQLNTGSIQRLQDPEIAARIEQFEMAYRMQSSIPALADLSDETEDTYKLYGEQARTPGTFAYNCLMARRLAEKDVRFIQLFHRGWDQHSAINDDLPKQARDVDQGSAALVLDLKRRGLLDDTVVVWGSEFGRTAYCQGEITDRNYGRDHHPRCFSVWLAGGGVRPGLTHGETDALGYNVVDGGLHIHDLNATLLHCLGVDHRQLTFPFKGRDFRLTDTGGRVARELLL